MSKAPEGDKMKFVCKIGNDEVTVTVKGYTDPVNAFVALQELGEPERIKSAAQGYLAALQHHRENDSDERAVYKTNLDG